MLSWVEHNKSFKTSRSRQSFVKNDYYHNSIACNVLSELFGKKVKHAALVVSPYQFSYLTYVFRRKDNLRKIIGCCAYIFLAIKFITNPT